MTQHRVTFSLPKRELRLKDPEVRVRSDDNMLGKLRRVTRKIHDLVNQSARV